MDAPTVEAVREWAQANNGAVTFDFARVGYGEPEDLGDPDALERPLASAVAYVEQTTGRALDGSLPANLTALAEDAVLMRLIQALATRGNQRAITDELERAGLASLRAGDFAVTFREGGRAKNDNTLLVNPWAALNEILLLLMTPERRAELLAEQNGTVPPAALGVSVADAPFCGDLYGGTYGYWP